MSNSVGTGAPNLQQVQAGVQGAQQEIQEVKEFNYQLSKFSSTMQKFAAEENVDKISIFSKPKDNQETKESKSRSAGTADETKSKNFFSALLSFDDPSDNESLDLINETFGLDIDAKDFSDVWDSIGVISEKLFNEKEKTFKELTQTINAFNEPPVDYKPTTVVVNSFDDIRYRTEFVA